ncbi:methylated-DNA--protein-cysteine methyltransferase [Oceanococcus atlanticus]|uniref:Methylated-DNA--protein-cysteine methyltransferase n=1 Tax=Oceanococcus atlanticus TaxID=1317117 RepID=A0A1Y1SB85_9GAMM|nr:methylated-DNA--[protein]-cysteine S-methyltransferase [Oceanococcus atlanticus]ORE85917.1 methylated-DNA--protein-cysteine methyltransferase [Oceanococcus atlanticus]
MNYTYLDSPLGRLLIAGDEQGLRSIHFPHNEQPAKASDSWNASDSGLKLACEQLREYFLGQRQHFDLVLAPDASAFQSQVLEQLLAIPFGQTRSYGQLAHILERPQAARAVGTACARNPLPIVIPCHRVIGQNGSLTGFAGGIEAKRWLLDHERAPRS